MWWMVELKAWDMDTDGESYGFNQRYLLEASNADQAIATAKRYCLTLGGMYGCSLGAVYPYDGPDFIHIPANFGRA